jgi:hypothetical protein
MFCLFPKVLNSKKCKRNTFSCIYKLSQSSKYEIRDCFVDEVIAQNHAFKL